MLGLTTWAEDFVTSKKVSYTPLSADAYAAERCLMDIYHPAVVTAPTKPVVVWFHGGGLEGGERYIPQELQDGGYIVVAPGYRLLPKCTIDHCIDDAAAAVAWTVNNIAKYGGDPAKIYVSGHSAGGYLADMIGLETRWLAAYGIDANTMAGYVPFSGQTVTHYNVRRTQGLGPLQPTIDAYAPLFHVRGDAAPFVIISGDRNLELYGRYEEQAYFWRMLKLTGHTHCLLYEMQGYDHGAMPAPAFHILKELIKGNLKFGEE